MRSPYQFHGPVADGWTEQQLFDEFESQSGALILASTVRGARFLQRRYNERQYSSGNAAWVSPQILAWDAWLESLWSAAVVSGAESRVLLNDAQEMELWRKTLAQDPTAAQSLTTVGSLAQLVQKASRQMVRYEVPVTRLRGDSSEDTRAFYRWCLAFEATCRRFSFLPPSMLESAALEWIRQNNVTLPARALLVGFDRTVPSQRSLCESLTAAGCTVQLINLRVDTLGAPEREIVFARSQQEEITAAAQWARGILSGSPGKRIGVIHPAVESARNEVERIFRRVLAPSSLDVRSSSPLPFEFSLGTPMNRLKPVRTALALLRWTASPLPDEEISWLIVHGCFQDLAGGDRARLDLRFRERRFRTGGATSLSSFIEWLSRPGRDDAPSVLANTLRELSSASRQVRGGSPRSCSEWRELIEGLLAAAHWNLLHPADSWEFQLLRRWEALLDTFSSLTTVTQAQDFASVLERLEALAGKTVFAVESSDAPVQILGATESAGLIFDAVWWMNARAGSWPAPGTPLPFLPWSVQREANMPHTGSTDFDFALQTTQRILESAGKIIVSFAPEEGDSAARNEESRDRDILLSPAVRAILPDAPVIELHTPTLESHPAPASTDARLEIVAEESAVPFAATRVSGGVKFLEFQAACPFRAFAELRLGSAPPAEMEQGLSVRAQGTLTHRILDRFWQETRTRAALAELISTDEHRQRLREITKAQLMAFVRTAEDAWQRALLELEAKRLEQRLSAWLEQEAARPDFTVRETEARLEDQEFSGIRIDCRIDRIDEVEQGLVLLDYKTGKTDKNSCEGERPDQPQLSAYAVLLHQSISAGAPIAGIAFANLNPKKPGFTSVASLPNVLELPANAGTGKNKNLSFLSEEELEQRLNEWTSTLNRLAEDFRAGSARNDPKKAHRTCERCEQGLLCRIAEEGSEAREWGDDDLPPEEAEL